MKQINTKKTNLFPYLLMLPSMIIFCTFIFYPFVQTVWKSFTFTNYQGQAVAFAGLENYVKLFQSERFLSSLWLSFRFAAIVGIPSFGIGFVLAVIATQKRKGGIIYETMYAIPMAIASAPAAAICMQLLSPNKSGILNYVLGTEIEWLLDSRWALYAVGLVTVWLSIGVNYIFLLTALRNVPADVMEGATIDGAGYFTKLFRVMVPIASPQIFFVVFLNITTSFQAFSQIRILTEGGPSYSTNVLVYSIYTSGIRDSRFETAFAQSIILFLIILTITMIQFHFEDKVVHYQ